MKGKFLFFGLTALALAVTACSLDETTSVNDENAIKFKAVVPHSTRAEATTASNLDAFQVWAFDGDGSTYMNHVVATGNNGSYTTSPTYYWPSGALDFYALSPVGGVSGESVTIPSDATTPVATATITSEAGTVEVVVPEDSGDQIDLVYAVATGKTSADGAVAMNFRHAFSQVVFYAKSTNEDYTIKVAGVRVGSVNSTATYTLPTVTTGTNLDEDYGTTESITDSQGTWVEPSTLVKTKFTALDLEADGKYIEVTDDAAALTSSSEGTALFMIPQEVAAWDVLNDHHDSNYGAYFLINCQVMEGEYQLWPNANETVGGSIPDYAEIAVPCEIAWEEGYKYTYTFVFGDGLGYYPPDDEHDPESDDSEATPVLVPITFTVTVDEFQSADEVEVSTNSNAITVHSAADLLAAIDAGYTDITVSTGDAESLDLTLESVLEFNYDCTLTIEEGVTITGPNATDDVWIDHNGTEGQYCSVIYVNGCNLTINGSGTVATTGDSNAYYTDAIWVVNGSVTVNGGTFKGSHWNTSVDTGTVWAKHAVYCGEGGKAYLYGGNYSAGNTIVNGTNRGGWALNIHNASWQDGSAMIYCYGGAYYDFDPSNPGTDDASSYVVADHKVVRYEDAEGGSPSDTGDWYRVLEN